jgi:Carbohydrate-selective porin, OprB family/S-layer homology domain
MNRNQLVVVRGLSTLSILIFTAAIAKADPLSTPAIPAEPIPASPVLPLPDNQPAIEAQFTSVSQLSDIQPDDWAFQALQSLIERYSCIVGYPDATYRGNRALSRYEFAAGLNACLDQIQTLLATATANAVQKEDLAVLSRLQDEFATELRTLQGRVDTLEAQTATLESQQFSTTTRLTGQAIFALNGGTQANAADPNIIFFNRERLNFNTSFNGNDRLLTQLQSGIGNNADAASFAQQEDNNFRNRSVELGEAQIQQLYEQIFPSLASQGLTLEDVGIGLANLQTAQEIQDTYTGIIRTLSLEAGVSPAEALRIGQSLVQRIETGRTINRYLQASSTLDYSHNTTSGLNINRLSYTFPVTSDLQISFFPQGYLSDYVDRNPYASNSANNFSTFGLVNNQLLLAGDNPGSGAAISWQPSQGALTVNVAYRAEQAAFSQPNSSSSIFGTTTEQGGIFNAPNLGVVELEVRPTRSVALRFQYSDGTQADDRYNAFGANLDVALGKHIGLFGRFGYALNFPGDINPTAWSAGLTFSDLFGQGNLAGIAIGQPLIFQDNSIGFFTATQTNYEGFYRFRLNDNISVSPIFQVITNPGNLDTDTIFTATLRTVFSF